MRLEDYRLLMRSRTPARILESAEFGECAAEKWAALEILADCNFSDWGQYFRDHRQFAEEALALTRRLWCKYVQRKHISRNFGYLIQAVFENADCWLEEHR